MAAVVLASLTVTCAAGVAEALAAMPGAPGPCFVTDGAFAPAPPTSPEFSVAALSGPATCATPMRGRRLAQTPRRNEGTPQTVGSVRLRSPPASD
jgi:hypothetical protein